MSATPPHIPAASETSPQPDEKPNRRKRKLSVKAIESSESDKILKLSKDDDSYLDKRAAWQDQIASVAFNMKLNLSVASLKQKAEFLVNSLSNDSFENWQKGLHSFIEVAEKSSKKPLETLRQFQYIFGVKFLDTSSFKSAGSIEEFCIADNRLIWQMILQDKWQYLEIMLSEYLKLMHKFGESHKRITMDSMRAFLLCAIAEDFASWSLNNLLEIEDKSLIHARYLTQINTYIQVSKLNINTEIPKFLFKSPPYHRTRNKKKKKSGKSKSDPFTEFNNINPLQFLLLKDNIKIIPILEILIQHKPIINLKTLLLFLEWDNVRYQNSLEPRQNSMALLKLLSHCEGYEDAKKELIKRLSSKQNFSKSLVRSMLGSDLNINPKLKRYEQATLYALYGTLKEYQEIVASLKEHDAKFLEKWPENLNPMKCLIDSRWLDTEHFDVMLYILAQQKELVFMIPHLLSTFIERLLLDSWLTWTILERNGPINSEPFYYYSKPHYMTPEMGSGKILAIIETWLKLIDASEDFCKFLIGVLLRFDKKLITSEALVSVKSLLLSLLPSYVTKLEITEKGLVNFAYETLNEHSKNDEQLKEKIYEWQRCEGDKKAAAINIEVFSCVIAAGFNPDKILENLYETFKTKTTVSDFYYYGLNNNETATQIFECYLWNISNEQQLNPRSPKQMSCNFI